MVKDSDIRLVMDLIEKEISKDSFSLHVGLEDGVARRLLKPSNVNKVYNINVSSSGEEEGMVKCDYMLFLDDYLERVRPRAKPMDVDDDEDSILVFVSNDNVSPSEAQQVRKATPMEIKTFLSKLRETYNRVRSTNGDYVTLFNFAAELCVMHGRMMPFELYDLVKVSVNRTYGGPSSNRIIFGIFNEDDIRGRELYNIRKWLDNILF